MSDKGKADTNRREAATRKSSSGDSHSVMDENAPVLNTPAEWYSDLPELISDSESSSCSSTDGDTEESESEDDG
jgi:hypothetical protein